MPIERATAKRGAASKITFEGRTIDAPNDYDPQAFARAIVRKRKPKMTLAERMRWQREAEAKYDD